MNQRWTPGVLDPYFWVGETAVKSGSLVDAAPDRSGNNLTPTGAGSNRPTTESALGGEVFNFSNDLLTFPTSPVDSRGFLRAVTSSWLFTVVRRSALRAAAEEGVFVCRDDSSEQRLALLINTTDKANAFGIRAVTHNSETQRRVVDTADGDTGWHMVFVQIHNAAGSAQLVVDGVERINASGFVNAGTTSNTLSGYAPTIGRSTGAVDPVRAGYFQMAAMLGGRNKVLSQGDLDAFFGWAAHKYGLTDSLPEGHPYKTDAPMLGPAVRPQHGRVVDLIFGGSGTVSGTVMRRISESTTLPQRALVSLYEHRGKRLVRQGWSDAETGAFSFQGLDTTRHRFVAVAEYPTNPDDPTAENYLRPVAGVSRKRGEGSS